MKASHRGRYLALLCLLPFAVFFIIFQIAPLAWVAANIPGASAIGISGIGAAPAMVALFAYSLLPVVSNTVVGLVNVPEAANDAARGMGHSIAAGILAAALLLAAVPPGPATLLLRSDDAEIELPALDLGAGP